MRYLSPFSGIRGFELGLSPALITFIAEVTTPYSETIELSYICIDTEGNLLDSRKTPIAFIEGVDYEQEDD